MSKLFNQTVGPNNKKKNKIKRHFNKNIPR